ncbi:MAG: DUF2169 domain-containing protein [Myxococcales bacterium]|nr:DUF2169 domain-containing protein [Myxococcales bacterium]
MKLVSDTPLRVGWLPWCFAPGDWRLVVAVKATLELPREGLATLAKEQRFVTGDEPWDDDPERSVRYAEDLALIKPKGEVYVTGTLRSAEPVQQLACYARAGDVEARFDVIGDRWWQPDGGQSEPVPFTEMELCWERCFGGPGYETNPLGRGVAADPYDALGRVALPNVEQHGRLLRSPGERPDRVGAWPIPRTWPERMRLMGTMYGAAYLRDRWPYFAEDFRWSHFQAAPEPQRIEGYWRGDEEIELARLHPAHPRVKCQLPGIRARAFVLERGREHGPLREVGMVLDTIAIDAGEGTATLLWRGSTPCAGEVLEELTHLYVRHEPLGPGLSGPEAFAAFVARLKAIWEEEQGLEAEAPPPLAPPRGAPEPPRVAVEEAPPAEADPIDAARARAREQGWPGAVIDELYPETPPAPVDPAEQRRKLEAALAAATDLGLDTTAGVLASAIERLDAAPPETAEEEAQRVKPPPGLWTSQELRDLVTARIAAGESLASLTLVEADLTLLDLSGQDLSGAILVRADLSNATLDGARLDGAILDHAKLGGATLRRASLRDASLSFVEADGADFTEAALDFAIAERAMLSGARFERVHAPGLALDECFAAGACFDGADLSEAELAGSSFDEASFRGATLTETRFVGSSLRNADLDQVHAPGLRASDGADLSEARIRYARLDGASFARSTMIGTKLTESRLRQATFAEAGLEGAELLAIDARGASFAGARLTAASLAGADLLGARFEGASLRLAELSGANLYGAELWQADLTDARLDGANVEGTKLA